MSVNLAINNALSGLGAQTRRAEVASRNIANADVEGYAAKRLELSQDVVGGRGAGVRIDGVSRAGDPMLTAQRRRAGAEADFAGASAGTARALSDLLGPLGPAGGLSQRFGALETTLRTLADSPDSAVARRAAFDAARSLARGFNEIAAAARQMRVEQDEEIGRQIDELNGALDQVARLNREIQTAIATGRDPSGLEDERDRRIELVNRLVPIRATLKDNGVMELRSADGSLLAGVQPARLDFRVTGPFDRAAVWPTSLSGARFLDGDGVPLAQDVAPTDGGTATLRGGALEAAFLARDRDIPAFLDDLDGLAQGVIDRFNGIVGADPGGDGLFVDGGAGGQTLSARLALNAAATDADRMQQGLDPGVTRPAGDGTVPLALFDAFMGRTGALPPPPDLSAVADDFAADRVIVAETAETDASWRQGVAEGLRESELHKTAVDTDAELQSLLAIERAYAANARVLQTVDELIRRLLEI